MRHALFILILLLAGCDRLERSYYESMGFMSHPVIVVEKPIVVSSEQLRITSNGLLRVSGTDAAVCLVLKGGVTSFQSTQAFKEFPGYDAVQGTLKTKDGKSFSLGSASESWSELGTITPGDEIAACFSCACNARPAIGSEITEITIQSPTQPLNVLGVYWDPGRASN
jgi:hypothetical protein